MKLLARCENNMEAIQHDTTPGPADLDPAMLCDIQHLVGRLIAKADQLIGKKGIGGNVATCNTRFTHQFSISVHPMGGI